MTYQLIRPVSAPYELTGTQRTLFLTWAGIADTLAPDQFGSFADDADSTYVTLASYQPADGNYYSTVVAVDFAVPDATSANASAQFGYMVRMARLYADFQVGSGTWQNTAWAVFDSSWTSGSPNLNQFGRLEDASGVYVGDMADTQTTYTSGQNYSFTVSDDAALLAVLQSGFTVAMFARLNNLPAPQDALRVTEFGLLVDFDGDSSILPYRAPLRLHPRSDARLWPRPGSARASGRTFGGYY